MVSNIRQPMLTDARAMDQSPDDVGLARSHRIDNED